MCTLSICNSIGIDIESHRYKIIIELHGIEKICNRKVYMKC